MASETRPPAPENGAQYPAYAIEVVLQNQLVVVIGAGRVALRKLSGLLCAGARVKLIDPKSPASLPEHPNLHYHQRDYQPEDLFEARLVFAATNNAEINTNIAAEAARQRILCCRVDCAAGSGFTVPARLLRPPLAFSISSGGENPAMAAALRNLLDGLVPDSWPTATRLLAAVRRKLLTEQAQVPYNQQVLLQLIECGLLELIACADRPAVDRLLLEHFGPGFSLKDLQFSFPEGTP